MRKWTVRAARAVLIGAAFAAIGGGIANADTTSGDGSILGGNQVQVPISVPVNVSGNAIGILGHAVAGGGNGSATVNYRNNVGDAGTAYRGGYYPGGYYPGGYYHGGYVPGGYVTGTACTGCAACAADCAPPQTCTAGCATQPQTCTTACATQPTCTSCPSACAASCPTTCGTTCTTADGKVIYMRGRAQHAK